MDDRELYHYGVLGMKWGVRRTAAQLGHQIKQRRTNKKRKANLEKARKAKIEKKKAEEERQKKLEDGKLRLKDMTDDEIKAKINRLELEKKYKDLQKEKIRSTRGMKFVDKFLDSTTEKLADNVASDLVAQTVKSLGVKFINDSISSVNKSIQGEAKKAAKKNEEQLSKIDLSDEQLEKAIKRMKAENEYRNLKGENTKEKEPEDYENYYEKIFTNNKKKS